MKCHLRCRLLPRGPRWVSRTVSLLLWVTDIPYNVCWKTKKHFGWMKFDTVWWVQKAYTAKLFRLKVFAVSLLFWAICYKYGVCPRAGGGGRRRFVPSTVDLLPGFFGWPWSIWVVPWAKLDPIDSWAPIDHSLSIQTWGKEMSQPRNKKLLQLLSLRLPFPEPFVEFAAQDQSLNH